MKSSLAKLEAAVFSAFATVIRKPSRLACLRSGPGASVRPRVPRDLGIIIPFHSVVPKGLATRAISCSLQRGFVATGAGNNLEDVNESSRSAIPIT